MREYGVICCRGLLRLVLKILLLFAFSSAVSLYANDLYILVTNSFLLSLFLLLFLASIQLYLFLLFSFFHVLCISTAILKKI